MAFHRIKLGVEAVEHHQVGNSMSTRYGWDPKSRRLTVAWKDDVRSEVVEIRFRYVGIFCGGGFPQVKYLVEPRNPVLFEAWLRCFYNKQRVRSRDEVLDAVNCDRFVTNQAADFLVQGQGFCFSYRASVGMSTWSPGPWWVDRSASVEAVRQAFERLKGGEM
jgi:hypothetical protein